MAASKTTNVAFRRSRHRSNKTAGVFESSGRFIAVEPNQHSSSAPLLERTDCDVTQYKLSLTIATELANALSRCAENGLPTELDVPVQIGGHVHHWEFHLEPAHGSGELPSHILGHGTNVTSRRQTVRDLNRVTKSLLSAQDDERKRIARHDRATSGRIGHRCYRARNPHEPRWHFRQRSRAGSHRRYAIHAGTGTQ